MPRRVQPTPPPEGPRVRDATAFGATVRAARTGQGLRIDDAAALCGVSVELLQALETGGRSVGVEKALHVATQLGVAVLLVPTASLPEVLPAIEAAKAR